MLGLEETKFENFFSTYLQEKVNSLAVTVTQLNFFGKFFYSDHSHMKEKSFYIV